MDLSFFTNREWALYTWLLGFIIWAVCESDIRKSGWNLIKAACQPLLVKLYVMTLVWTLGSVWLLTSVGIWQPKNLKTTILWFLTYALISLMQAHSNRRRPDYYRKLMLDTVNITILLAFFADAYPFSLVAEFVLVPVSVLIFGLAAVAGMSQFDGEQYIATRKVVAWGPPLFGLFILGHSLIASFQIGGFVTVENLRDMVMPSFLSVLFFPFLHAFCLLLAYENMHFGIPNEKLRRYGVWKSVWAFKFRQRPVDEWRRQLNLNPANSREEIDQSIHRTLKSV